MRLLIGAGLARFPEKRSAARTMIGLALGWFGQLTRGLASGEPFGVAATHVGTLRIFGVPHRLALAYDFSAQPLVPLSITFSWLFGHILKKDLYQTVNNQST